MRLSLHARWLALAAVLALATEGGAGARAVAQRPTPSMRSTPPAPPLPREFRAVWVATKGNIDWPSRPGLSVARQQAELAAILDDARALNLNAVILQVRPQADALYSSSIEPWSEYLSGREGYPPAPLWDPLLFAVREAHARGLEMHAWLNPFRAKAETSKSPPAPANFARQHPEFTVRYGNQIFLDPGEPAVREHALRVVTDIVGRYDVDAIHVDDYFYPYPVKDAAGRDQPFADDASWQRVGRVTGLDRSHWRRQNIDDFVRRAGAAVHSQKAWVQFGVSPFGIWRPGNPPMVRGLDAYEVLASDSRRWIAEGWVDYAVPQLYWTLDQREQPFGALLAWWAGQNPKGRHLYAGIASARIGKDRNAAEILNQVGVTRRQPGVDGVAFWNASSLRANLGGIAPLLRQRAFVFPALPPASPWLSTNAPAVSEIGAKTANRRQFVLGWQVDGTNGLRGFALQIRRGTHWSLEILPPERREAVFPVAPLLPPPDELRLTPVGRAGATGVAGSWRR
ncbi:MAG: family 10 glycosylhydrolase [Verrucomicrobia bacterium]|nr:MAG: family 10 glycosylhydrolase [Verrucomicrobiota bacterium]